MVWHATFYTKNSIKTYMKTILVPTDFSQNAIHAALYAGILAKNLNAKIIFLNVFSVPIVSENELEYIIEPQIISKQAQVDIETEAAKNQFISSANIDKNVVTHRVEYGFAKDKIVEIANEIKADMIVMGTKGATNALERWLGTTAQSVMKAAECPVWIIPVKTNLQLPRNIMYAADYQEDEFTTMHKLLALTGELSATCTAVHIREYHELKIGTEAHQMANDLKNEFEQEDVSFKNLNRNEIVKGLEGYIKSSKPDVVAMAVYEKSFFSRIFDTSITKHFAQETNIPMLTFKKAMVS